MLTLLLLMSWQLGGWLAQGLKSIEPPGLPSLLTPENTAQTSSPRINLWGVPELISAAKLEKPAVEAVESAARRTRLNAVLLGVIQAEPYGVAIIQVGRETKVLSVGENLQAQVSLAEIGTNYAILQNRGVRERLEMDDQTAGLLVQGSEVNHPSKADSAGALTRPPSQLAPEQAQQLQTVSQEIRQNPMRIGQYVRFEPLRERDEWLGIRIGPRNHPEIFSGLGFREGDLVVSINGLTVADMAQNPAVWNQFLQESRFSLVVNRDGLNETIDVDLSQ